MKPILQVENVSKKYRIRHRSPYLSLRERMKDVLRPDAGELEDFYALENVSFEVAQGESIGIIGRNGAGKSTILKVLSKITMPSSGRVVTRGRIASLLEVGTGFHPELTGRENTFFNGSLLGMKRREIEMKFDEIVEFSGVEKFLDTPLKHYSSGMQLRLAFAVAAFLDPEILVVDEVLAVGDAEFQRKCLGKMEDVSRSGRTILLVSHNMAAVENLCQKGILLENGKIVRQGPVADVIDTYQQSFADVFNNEWKSGALPTTDAYLTRVGLELSGEQPHHRLKVVSHIGSRSHHKSLYIAFDISSSRGTTIFQAIPKSEPFIHHSSGEQIVNAEIDLPPLIPDQYRVSVWLGSHNTETICWEKEVVAFEIVDSPIQGRSFPHSHHNGFLISKSRIVND